MLWTNPHPNQDGTRACHRLSKFGTHFIRRTLTLAVILLWQSGTTRREEQDGTPLKLKMIT